MKQLFNFILSFFIMGLLVLTGCAKPSQDRPAAPPGTPNVILLKKMVSTDDSGHIYSYIDCTYDSTNHLVSYKLMPNSLYTTTVNNDSLGRVAKLVVDSAGVVVSMENFYYNPAGKLIKAEYCDRHNVANEYHTYQYFIDSFEAEHYQIVPHYGLAKLDTRVYTYTSNGKNIDHENAYDSSGFLYEAVQYGYDNHKGAYLATPDILFVTSRDANNFTSIKVTDTPTTINWDLQASTRIGAYTYTYNAYDYPITRIEASSGYQVTYEYIIK